MRISHVKSSICQIKTAPTDHEHTHQFGFVSLYNVSVLSLVLLHYLLCRFNIYVISQVVH